MSEILQKYRSEYPQYNDIPDQELATALHGQFYSSMDETEFMGRVGVETPAPVKQEESFVDKSINSVLDFSDKMTTPITYADAPAVQQGTNKLKFDLNDPVPIIGRTEEYNTIATKLPHEKSMFELIEREQAGLSDSANMDEYKEFRDLSKDEQIRNVIPRNLGFGMIGEAFYEPGETEQAYEQRLQNTPVIERRRLAQAKEDDLLRQGQRAVSQDIHKTTVGADLKNVAQGMGTRAFDLAGNLAIAADIVLRHQDVNPRAKNQDMPKFEGWESPIRKTGEFLKDSGDDLGYEEGTNWEDVKFSARNKGLVNPQTYIDIAAYGFEQTVKSIPDMIAALYVMPSYVVARTAEIGEERAKNDGRDRADLSDMRAAAPAALASALFERIGAKGITKAAKARIGKEMMEAGFSFVAKQGLKGATVESSTEFFQEGVLEYIGEKWGTEAKMSLSEMFDRGAGGALAGGLGGGTISSAGASVNVLNAKQGKKGARTEEIQGRQAEVDAKNIAEFNKEAERQAKDKPTIKISEEPLKKGEFRKLYLDGPVAKFTAKKKADDINRQFDLSEDATETEFYINDAFAEDAIQEIRDLNDLISSGSLTDAEINNELSKITGVETNPSDATKDSLSNEISQLESKQSSITEDNSIRLNIINNLEKINSESLPSNLKKGIKGDIPIAWLSKEGVSIDEAAHKAWENLPDNMREQYNTLDVKNIIEEVIQSNKKDALNEAMGDPQKIKGLKKAQRDTNKKQPAKEVKSKADQGAPTTLTGEQTQERKRIDERDTRLVKVRSNVNDVADLIRGGKDLKARPAHMKKINFELTKAMELDKADTIKQLQKLDDELQDVGGLLKVVGARSKAGKIFSEVKKDKPSKARMWFVNYTENKGSGRTTETKSFKKLSDANEFSKNKHGWISRYDDESTSFHDYFGGFEPSAIEHAKIKAIKSLVAKPDVKPTPSDSVITSNSMQAGSKTASKVKSDPKQDKAVVTSHSVSTDEARGNNYVESFSKQGFPERSEKIIINNRTVKLSKKPQRIEPIKKQVTDIIGNRIYSGKIKGSKATQGFYRSLGDSTLVPDYKTKKSVGELRLRKRNDVEVLAHEMAHHLDFYKGGHAVNFHKSYNSPRFSKEVDGLSYTDKESVKTIEGFAEFTRLWLTNSAMAKEKAPMFYHEFGRVLHKDKALNKKMSKLQESMHRFYNQGPDFIGRALIGDERSISQKLSEWKFRRHSLWRQGLLDKTHALRKAEQELTKGIAPAENSAWKLQRLSNGGVDSMAEYVLQYGTITFDGKGSINRTGKGLGEVFKPIEDIKPLPEHKKEGTGEVFLRYLRGLRALELHKQNRENLIPKQTAEAWVREGKKYKGFWPVAKEFYAFNDRNIDMLVASGVLSEDGAKAIRAKNKFYAPSFRVKSKIEGTKGGQGGGATLKRLTGGDANLKDIMESIEDGVLSSIKASMNNLSKQKFYEMIASHEDGATWAVKLDTDSKKMKVHMSEVKRELINALESAEVFDSEQATDEMLDNTKAMLDIVDLDSLMVWQHGVKPNLGNSGTIVDSVMVDGKPLYYEVKDPLFQDMLMKMTPDAAGKLLNAAFMVKHIFTRTITGSVEFALGNFARDAGGSAVMGRGLIPLVSTFKGMNDYITKSDAYKEWMKSGGAGSMLSAEANREIKARKRAGIKKRSLKDIPGDLFEAYTFLFDAVEAGPRIAQHSASKKAGASDMQAGFEAREVSTDFSSSGNNPFIQSYIKMVGFLNAMLQSQDRLYRGLQSKEMDGHRASIAMKGFVYITVPSLLSWLAFKDDEDYKAEPEYKKNTNLYLGKKEDGTFIKLPLPYDVGFAFGTIPRLSMQYLHDEKGEDYANGMIWTINQMWGMDAYPPTPAFLEGAQDIAKNETWTGSPVVPQSLVNVDAEQQYTSKTSPIFIELGKKLGVSPIKAEHLFKAQTGYMGKYALAVTNRMMWDEEKWGEQADYRPEDNILLKRFISSPQPRITSYMSKYFDLKEEADKVVATFNYGTNYDRILKGEKPADKFEDDGFSGRSTEEKRILFGLSKKLAEVTGKIYGKRGMKTQELEITYDKELSGSEKRKQLDTLYYDRNEIFERMVKHAEEALTDAKKLNKKTEK